MAGNRLAADYLVIGCGAMGMAFTDVLMTETDATVIMVDRYHQPGGHWNCAYPFVRLHQPSSFYGVNSKALGSNTIDATGWNKGLYELATNGEVCAYFDQVMQQQFLPSGRVQYFPMCEYKGDQHFTSLVSATEYDVDAKKIVDATYMHVMVPSMRPPPYEVAEGVTCVPPNGLPRLTGTWDRYVVIGAGKTGMDACLFLLKNGVSPERIGWVMPRDAWLFDRADIQGGQMSARTLNRWGVETFEAIAESESIGELFANLSARGLLLRLDETRQPTMWRCATVTKAELEQLRKIQNIIRMGHVQRLEPQHIVLDQGTTPTSPTTLHIDCTADGLERRPATPVFTGRDITLQSVRMCQQVFSAAFIGHVEAAYDDKTLKNDLCTPVPHPDTPLDYLRTTLGNLLNEGRWAQDADLQAWLKHSRLDFLNTPDAPGTVDVENVQRQAAAAVDKLRRWLAEVDGMQHEMHR
jgi:hypothetical protein